MATIHVLDNTTINQIAAGEVIDSPASVVKELIENAIDAHASSIVIEIVDGGKQLIRVTDNGRGMSFEDAPLALQRHATSKIATIDDLWSLNTMGFRGEALAAIASVSKISLLTALNEGKGTSLEAAGGTITSCTQAACLKGTTISVEELFFNTPARRKFQKSSQRTTQQIVQMLTQIALGHPEISFELLANNKKLLFLPPTTQKLLNTRIELLLGKEFATNLLPVTHQENGWAVEGYSSKPSFAKTNRLHQYIYINKRSIVCPLISYALKLGYGTAIDAAKFPVSMLYFTMPYDSVDVNVHPQKKEVRFRDEEAIRRFVIRAVSFGVYPSTKQLVFAPLPIQAPAFSEQTSPQESFYFPSAPEKELQLQLEEEKLHCIGFFAQWLLLDQPHSKQLRQRLAADMFPQGMLVLDAKKIWSRILFEKLSKKSAPTVSQPLLIPLCIELAASQAVLLESILEELEKSGFHIRSFGNNSFIIDAYPQALAAVELDEFIRKMVQEKDEEFYKTPARKMAKIATQISDAFLFPMNHEKAHRLLKELLLCDDPAHDPYGMPLARNISLEEIKKKFLYD